MRERFLAIYRHRALVAALVARELKARYRGSLLGFLWSFLNPLLLMLVYFLAFTTYMRFDMEKYSAFLLTGLLPWLWFSSSVNEGTVSIISGGNLIKKVMFPAEILPLVSVVTNLVHYLLSLVILIPFLLIYQIPLNPLILVPYFVVLVVVQFIFTLGLSLGLSALTVHLRDIQHIISNLLVLWFFCSPIIYPMSVVPQRLKPLTLALNPVSHLMMGYHKIFFYSSRPETKSLLAIFGLSCLVFLAGWFIFEHFRDSFAEEV